MNKGKHYRDRYQAGEILAALLGMEPWPPSALVLGLPRGGVPVAAVIAAQLNLALDVLIVRKLGLPEQPEVAMGAIASGDIVIINDGICSALPNPSEVLEKVIAFESSELKRREDFYHADRDPLPIAGRTVILVDDGLATGATMRAALEAVHRRGAERRVVAVPVASEEALESTAAHADRVICPYIPEYFRGVGSHYDDFEQTGDEEVSRLLRESDLVR